MGNGQWAMGKEINTNSQFSILNSQLPIPNCQYFGFPAGRYANGEAMPQALRSVQVPNAQYFDFPAGRYANAQYKFPMPNAQCPITSSLMQKLNGG
jgi:hypothetical protein